MGEGLIAGGKKSGRWRPVALLLAIGTILILFRVFEVGGRIGEVRDWIDGLGPWGPVVFVVLYAAAVVAALPGSVLTVAAGALFGSITGIICVSIASILGASFAFLIARYFAREATARWLSGNEKFRRLDELTEERGAIIVAFTRLVPLFPFNLLNYGFGLTRVRFWTYVFWSWLCMLPATVLYVVGADAVFKAIAEKKIPWMLTGVLGAMGVLLIFLIRTLRRKLPTTK